MITVLIPVNRLDRAKGRLGDLLTEDERRELAWTTFTTVLDGCPAGPGWRTVVLTADSQVARMASRSAQVLPEDSSAGSLTPQLERAIRTLAPDRLIIVHADLPLFAAGALPFLAGSAAEPPCAVINPSPDGGTNAMYLSECGRFPLAYGPGSAQKHLRAAEAAGMAVRFVHNPSLDLDLDTPADLATLLSTAAGRKTLAGQLLLRMGIPGRLGIAGP